MDQLEAMRVFVAVAETGGFAAAARHLRLSPPAVTRAVAGLEATLGTRLLHRTTRSVRLSDAGERFLTDSIRILAELEEAQANALSAHAGLHGRIAITAPLMFGSLHVAPLLLEFLDQHPKLQARALFVDRVVDLVSERFDAAVRIARLGDSSLSAQRVGTIRRVVCGAPSYLRKHPKLRTPGDLEKHEVISFHESLGEANWSFPKQARVSKAPRARLIVNNTRVAVEAVLAGAGLTRVPSYMVAEHVKSGALAIVLSEFEPPPIPVHFVRVEGRRDTARVRAFTDFATRHLRRVLERVNRALSG